MSYGQKYKISKDFWADVEYCMEQAKKKRKPVKRIDKSYPENRIENKTVEQGG